MPHPNVIHVDDVEPRDLQGADIRARRLRLGAAAGALRVGLSRYVIAPGCRHMPLHVHGDEEEITYVLAGTGWSVEGDGRFAVGPGDCVVHRPGGAPHTFFAGEDGELDLLVFGSGSDSALTWLPRAGAWFAGPRWMPADGPHPFRAEAAAGPLALPAEVQRPAHVSRADTVAEPFRETRPGYAGVDHDLARAAGSVISRLRVAVMEPGQLSGPPHCHTMEEELFVVLQGDGTVLLGDEEHPIRPGSVVARPPDSGVAHAVRAGDDGLTYLAYGTRVPGDCVFYPRSNKILIGRTMFRVEPIDYWEGEP